VDYTAAFGLLDLYGLHFLLVPYYSGLIFHSSVYRGVFSHRVLSRVPPARLQGFTQTGFSAIANRLVINKSPILTSGALFSLWLVYVVATLYLLASSWQTVKGRRFLESQNATLRAAATRNSMRLL
jgi:hypothetical protein